MKKLLLTLAICSSLVTPAFAGAQEKMKALIDIKVSAMILTTVYGEVCDSPTMKLFAQAMTKEIADIGYRPTPQDTEYAIETIVSLKYLPADKLAAECMDMLGSLK